MGQTPVMGNSMTSRVVSRLALMTGALLVGWGLYVHLVDQQTREEDEALVWDACVERFGGEAQCEEHLDRHHTRCHQLTYTYVRPGRDPPRDLRKGLDQEDYLDCLELSPEVWKVERKPREIPNFPKVESWY